VFVSLAVLASGAAVIAPTGAAPAGQGRPNIMLILFDDAREDGVMNNPEVLPKTKKWLQQGGTTFAEGYATTPLCCPERATLWSGRLPHNHQVVDNASGDNLDHDWIAPRYLRDAGYFTAIVGKFKTDWKFRYEPPHFDQYAVLQGGYVDVPFWVRDPGDPKHRTVRAPYSTDFVADKAVEYVKSFEADDDKPWFMQVSPHAPHNIVEATKKDCEMSHLYAWPARHDSVRVPAWAPTPAVTVEGNNKAEKLDKVSYVQRSTFPASCAEVTHTGHMKTLLAADEMVDRVMSTLEAAGELSDTLVIFTTDNGFSWGERGTTSKGLPYTESIKAPFLARWDGVFEPGSVDPRPAGGEDLLPTYLDAAGYAPPRLGYAFDGRSLLPGRQGRDVKYLEFGHVGRSRPATYEGHRSIPTWASLRTAGWQYLEYYEDDGRTVNWREYYELTSDPWMLDNLLADQTPANDPDVGALSGRLQRLASCQGTTGDNPCP
jgi:arylsulfatase A-like enzyme